MCASVVSTGLAALLATACSSSGTTSTSSSSSSTAASGSGIPAGPIKVGIIEPLSGSLAPLGNGVLASTRAFINQLNAAGGIDGHTLSLTVENDQGNPATAVSEAEQLASQGVVVTFGASLGSSLAEALPVFMKDKIVVIDNEATDAYALNTSQYPYYFTVQPINRDDMQAMVDYASQHHYKVGILTDGLPYSTNLTSDFKSEAASAGVTVVGTETYSPTAVDLSVQVTKLKDAGATAIATDGETQFSQIYAAMKQVGFNVPVLGDAVTPLVPGAPSDTVSPCLAPLQQGGQPTAAEVAAANVIKSLGLSSTSVSVTPLYRDEVLLYAMAVKAANSTDPVAVTSQLEKLTKVAPTTPGYMYSFTSSSHAGWAGVDGACVLSPVGPDGFPYAASQ
jgi:branched-chain amino acid transport system substrate-binding protein